MNSEAIESGPHSAGWDRIVEVHAATVWATIRSVRLPEEVALEVNQLTWMRFADSFETVDCHDARDRLCEIARREAIRSAKVIGTLRQSA